MSWRKVAISENENIYKAIQLLESIDYRVVLVVDENARLKGTITDGDIRRGILKGISLDSSVTEVMNRTPVTAFKQQTRDELIALFKSLHLKQIPIIDHEHHVIGIETLDHITWRKNADYPVVLMAGGLGTRLSPLTDDIPKPMLEIGGKPMLERIITGLSKQGFTNFYIVVNYKSEMIKKYFQDGRPYNVSISYVDETKRLGTVGGIYFLKKNLHSTFLMLNADLITDLNFDGLIDYHHSHSVSMTLAVKRFDVSVPYGVVHSHNCKVTSIEEKPNYHYFVSAGIYVLEPTVFSYIEGSVYQDMPELVLKLLEDKKEVASFPIHEYWSDIGRHDDYKQAQLRFETA